jgi:hypothetical protein
MSQLLAMDMTSGLWVVLTLLSLKGMLAIMAPPAAEELPLPLLTLCLSSGGEIGPGELSICEKCHSLLVNSTPTIDYIDSYLRFIGRHTMWCPGCIGVHVVVGAAVVLVALVPLVCVKLMSVDSFDMFAQGAGVGVPLDTSRSFARIGFLV